MNLSDRIHHLSRSLAARVGCAPRDVQVVYSPLRVCPLGAHVDHQGGLVTGMALDRCLLLAFVPRSDDRVLATSLNYGGVSDFRLGNVPAAIRGDWGNYARGAAAALLRHQPTRGIDALVHGDTPVGGLSSSAALGIAFLLALEAANALEVPVEANVLLDRYVENEYLGLQNGILDQSIILMARPDHLTFLDCQTMEMGWIPPGTHRNAYEVVVAYSGLERSLMRTDYNKRVQECREAAAAMLAGAGCQAPDPPTLRAVPESRFDSLVDRLSPPLDKRARHYIGEIRRVREGVAAWRQGDLRRLGELVTASGASSIANYQCGSRHLIDLYEILSQCSGVFGARFAGGGFRGCCVGLSDPACRDAVRATVQSRYTIAHPECSSAFQIFFARSGGPAQLIARQ